MIDRPRYATPESLPDILPIFPLPGAVLLPYGRMPLNIFEPRYLAMVESALGHGRFIGMVQPREADRETVGDEAAVFETGGVASGKPCSRTRM